MAEQAFVEPQDDEAGDHAAAEDARAALEWIAGEQGRAFITQERIQGFCWYELPVKLFVDLDEKLRVVAALAERSPFLTLRASRISPRC